MNVETSEHDELWTRRRGVTMNVDIETLMTVIGDETSAVVVSVDYQWWARFCYQPDMATVA